jgi:transposase
LRDLPAVGKAAVGKFVDEVQAIHRVRDRLVSRRTSVINQIRAFLLERGLVFGKKPAKLKAAMADILENAEADLTPLMRNLIDTLWGEWKTVEVQVEELNDELERIRSPFKSAQTSFYWTIPEAMPPRRRKKVERFISTSLKVCTMCFSVA